MERSQNRTPEAYKKLETASAAVLVFMTLWAPWALGSTTKMTQGVLSGAGFLAGLFLAGKWWVRRTTGYAPPRWVEPTPLGLKLVRLLAVLTVVFLLYVLIGVLNARAVGEYIASGPTQGVNLIYLERTPISWLPSSYDRPASWDAFVRWTSLALAFWAARDWFLGKTRSERRETDPELMIFPGDRLMGWFWALIGSSFVLAVVSIIQRVDGTEKLLWLVTPRVPNPNSPWGYPPNFHFGPFNYRGNAAQYFNLIWPVAVAFWWNSRGVENRLRGISARAGEGPHVLLLPWAVILGATPIVTANRGGALVAVILAVGTGMILSSSRSIRSVRGRFSALGVVVLVLAVGAWIGGRDLLERIQSPQTNPYSSRVVVYEAALRMVTDFRWLGGGADTFATLHPFYRNAPTDEWFGYAHNDWLESVITLGIFGTAILVALLVVAVLIPWMHRRDGIPTEFVALLGLALGGILLHASWDFPFQIMSLQLEFLFLLAALTTFGRKGPAT